MAKRSVKTVYWVGSSLSDLRGFPKAVREVMGQALYHAQCGSKHLSAKPLKGFGGASVLEVVEDHDKKTYRAVYTVKFRDAVYVLHAFQKIAKKGIRTPKSGIDLIKIRLKAADNAYKRSKE